jgi:pimeloyl-ACP methyl ester carboxylesterase
MTKPALWMMRRRTVATMLAASVATAVASALLSGCTGLPLPAAPAAAPPPIIFVHGNGDSAALWLTTLWRFESQGWPRERLFALNLPYPQAREDDNKPQEGRSSTAEQMQALAAEVERVRRLTGADKVVLMANSRGGNTVRNYIHNGGGVATVSHAILCGVPNHGVWAIPSYLPGSEFNGSAPFLTALNTPRGPQGLEVMPGVQWLTLRSDQNDKYAQPDGVWIGAKGTPTNVRFDGPALKGARNVVLPGRDHREVAFHAEAFAAAYTFITERAPGSTAITPEASVVLDGSITGYSAGAPTNLPLAGAQLAVYAVDANTGQRSGASLLDKTVGVDGRWGPLDTGPGTALEFVIQAPGMATTHLYRSPFPRSSAIVHLRPERPLAAADRTAAAVLLLTRPRGYFGLPRDVVQIDGAPAPGIPPGVAGVALSKLKLDGGAGRAVVAEYRSGAIGERITGLAWPARDAAGNDQVTVLELHQ